MKNLEKLFNEFNEADLSLFHISKAFIESQEYVIDTDYKLYTVLETISNKGIVNLILLDGTHIEVSDWEINTITPGGTVMIERLPNGGFNETIIELLNNQEIFLRDLDPEEIYNLFVEKEYKTAVMKTKRGFIRIYKTPEIVNIVLDSNT